MANFPGDPPQLFIQRHILHFTNPYSAVINRVRHRDFAVEYLLGGIARTVVINPTALDAYIAKKGLTPRVSDAEWQTILQRVAALFGRELWHRCRLIHQVEDAFRRYSTVFPDAVPQPYRYIHYLEFIAFPSQKLSELQQWLTERGIVWRERRQFDADTEQEQVVGLQIFGYDPDHAT